MEMGGVDRLGPARERSPISHLESAFLAGKRLSGFPYSLWDMKLSNLISPCIQVL